MSGGMLINKGDPCIIAKTIFGGDMELIYLFWLGCAFLCWIVANSKARTAGIWLLLGLFLGPLALLAVGLMPSIARADGPTSRTHVKCPDCRELVLKDANICKHCRCKLVPQPG